MITKYISIRAAILIPFLILGILGAYSLSVGQTPEDNSQEIKKKEGVGSAGFEKKTWKGPPGSFVSPPSREIIEEMEADKRYQWPQIFSKEGITVEVNVEPVGNQPSVPNVLMTNQDVNLRVKISDTASGDALPGVGPTVWIDTQVPNPTVPDDDANAGACKNKIQSFLQGSLALRPTIDLNTYYILALNKTPNISVIDPLLGYFNSKLITLISLVSPGEDWVLSRDGQRLFVTMPIAKQVAEINTETWKVVANIKAGPQPGRIAFQPDERYIWIGNDAVGDDHTLDGVSVLDPDTREVIARIPTGAGHHEFAFSADSRYAFVTNQGDGTVTIIDIRKLTKIKNISTGGSPISLAYSGLAEALYVADQTDGRITIIDGKRHQVLQTINANPGFKAIRFTPDGRWGFAVNYSENLVYIIDSSDNRVRHRVKVGDRPDQIAFTEGFGYIRATGSDQVYSIQLSLLDKEQRVPALKFPAGKPAEIAAHYALADVMVPTPEDNVILIANPTDKTVFYYMEGMLAPMGSFRNYNRVPKAVLVVDRSLSESAPGVYTTTFRLPESGVYDVAFLMDNPLVYTCFEMKVKDDPILAAERRPSLHLEVLSKNSEIKVGQSSRLQLKLTDPQTSQPRSDIKDLKVLFFPTAGNWRKRVYATSVGGGFYEAEVKVPQPGRYRVFFECPSMNIRINEMPTVHLTAIRSQ